MAKKSKRRSRGAGCLFQKKAGGVFYARWQVDGKVYVRSCQTTLKRKAEVELAEFVAPFRLGEKRATVKALTAKVEGVDRELEDWKDGQPALTMLEAWGAFVAKPKGKTPRGRVIMPGKRTLADYEGRWNVFCEWMDKNYPKKDTEGNRIPWELRQIGKEHAERYIAEIGAGRSANTRNKSLTFLRLVFKVLAEDARIKTNPFEGMDAAPLAVTRKRPLTMTELGTISKNLVGKGEMETLFSLGYYTGARLGDCVLMRWDSIDMGARTIRYTPHKTAKSNREITLTISPALFALLNRTPSDERKGLVLPELGELYRKDPSAVSKRIQQVFIDAGIETDLEVEGYGKKVACVGFHSLRHGHITALLEGGAPMESVRARVGHSTIDMTAKYYHDGGEATERALKTLPAFGGTPAATTDAAGSGFDAVLHILDGLTGAELKTLILSAKGILNGRAGK